MMRRNSALRLTSGLGLVIAIVLLHTLVTVLLPRTAVASPAGFTVEVTIDGEGEVSLSPDETEYEANEIVELTANPDPGWLFAGWSDTASPSLIGPDLVMEKVIQIEVITDDTITAKFIRCYKMEMAVDPLSSGTVHITVNESNDLDPPLCQPPEYANDTILTLVAESAPGYEFSSWSEYSSLEPTIDITMDGDKFATANFTKACRILELTSSEGGSDPTAIPENSSGCGVGQYTGGESIELTANPDPGWQILSWSGTDDPDSSSLIMPYLEEGQHTVQVTYIEKPTLQFSSDSYTVQENDSSGEKEITVVRTGNVNEYAAVPYTISGDTAILGEDFLGPTSGTLEFAAGQDTKSFFVRILDDDIAEGNETILLKLEPPLTDAKLGLNDEAVLQIEDDEGSPTLQFETVNFAHPESTGTIRVDVTLFPTSKDPVSVKVKTNAQTATADADYNSAIQPNDEISYFPGDTIKTIYIQINEDRLDEADETFELELYGAVDAQLGDFSTATITIMDNDIPPTVQFSSEEYTAVVGETETEVVATLSDESGQSIEVDYSVRKGNSETHDSGIIVFPPGTKSSSIFVDITGTVDKDEFLIELSNAEKATLGSPVNASLYVLSTTPSDCHALSFTYSGSGLPPRATVLARSLGCQAGHYVPGELISVEAQPDPGWFVNTWQGTINDNALEIQNVVRMPDEAHVVKVDYVTRVYMAMVKRFDFFLGTVEVEPNDTFVSANGPLQLGQTYYGSISETPGDNPIEDRFYFELGETTSVAISLNDIPENRDYDLFLYDENWAGGYIAESVENKNAPEEIEKRLSPGKYYISVYSGNNDPSSSKYKLKVEAR